MAGRKRGIGLGRKRSSSDTGGWEVVYSGFILIMLCFFIMLCSFSTIEEAKVMRFVKSFSTAVSILTGGLKFTEGSEVLNPSPDIIDKRNSMANLLVSLEEIIMQVGISKEDVSITYTDEGLAIRLANRVVFNLGEAGITEQALPFLEKIRFLIRRTNYDVRVEGHTDNVPICTPEFPSNWELSTSRAVNVLRYFLADPEIRPDRLSAVGFGEFQPLVPNDTAENRAVNRRVEIVFVGGKMPNDGLTIMEGA